MLAPDALHGHERQAQLGGELAAAPVRRAVLGLALERVVEHPRFQPCQIASRCPTRMTSIQPPPGDRRSKRVFHVEMITRVAAQLTHDRLARGPFIEQQDQSRAPHLTHGHRCGLRCLLINSRRSASLRFISSHAPTNRCISHWFNRLGLQRLSYRPPYFRLRQIEIRVVRLRAVVHGEAAFKGRIGGHAVREHRY